ncbi:Flp pilus assembly protein CpaB [Nocardioides bizhenqiangii]|uniref:SAF domain-containing protein n=1 Tax=Nocardioides bizhenqiangii TaxID=3095076 RepID=A0ABZ0ZS98_9ACTN|nr:SAF domain-containing protein [Nocardioides sp. HM61]WQQ27140.1 SAF domain-containing protein [Nocardioides sp. HM61]
MATRDLPARVRDRLTAVRRAVLRRRRLLAVLCTVGAVAAGLRATAPPAAPTEQVLVAVRDLPAGAVLDGDDLHTVEVEPDRTPDGVLTDAEDAAGAILAAPLRAGEPVTDVRLVGPDLVDSAPGTIALPVRVSDAAQVGLLEVGDEIDLLATDPESRTTTTVASGVLVLAVPAPDQEAPDAIPGRLVVVGIPVATVADVTGAAVTSFLTYAWTSR